MLKRLKVRLFSLLCLSLFGYLFIIIFSSKTNNDTIHGLVNVDTANSAPYSLNVLRRLFSANTVLSPKEILFYDFVVRKNITNTAISKADHDKETQDLVKINSKKEELVKLKGDTLFSFNLLASNRVGSARNLPDTRHQKCPRVEKESTDHFINQDDFRASIVICYYNEAPSALLRTVNSLILRSPVHLLKEIIIVDDYSEPDYDANNIISLVIPTQIKVITAKTTRREGLIRSRLFGANLASGKVLIFLDSHVEANIGWLEPLMSTVREDNKTVACPMIDVINRETMIYSPSPMVKGGLNWALHFKWDSVPSEKLKSPEDFIKPIDSPTMAGGLYAIDRDYFQHIGTYDNQMELWGGENVEMSLRVWLCGGRIKILPCSRVGHIFRKKRPYGPKPNEPDSLLVNSHRTAKIWLDEFIDLYYDHYPHARQLDVTNIEERLQLRHRLNCRNISWYIDEIYPQLNQDLVKNNSGSTIQPD